MINVIVEKFAKLQGVTFGGGDVCPHIGPALLLSRRGTCDHLYIINTDLSLYRDSGPGQPTVSCD